MKPITDEIVRSLIERAERRETAACPANITVPASEEDGVGQAMSRRIISFDFMRRRVQRRQTVSGLFVYASPRLRS
jgi:hypothetical protein